MFRKPPPATDVEQLYRESRQALTSYFARRHGSTQSTEDLLQETFLRLMRRVDRCLLAASPKGYLFGIARHVSADTWRRTRPMLSEATALESIEAPRSDQRLEEAREIIAVLPALQREILDLRFQHDLSYAEIAEALNIPIGTVRSRLHGALEILREKMEQD
ncbi:MAG TPA: sigma-70 family RNA polymerase sigma factor [Verrucomicrobiae bacterium]|nr:sigma-70 family RNA polymerase sigma factor [Verrucomicrobiae bacterium]